MKVFLLLLVAAYATVCVCGTPDEGVISAADENKATSPKEWKAAIGRSTWHLLHSMAAKYPETPTSEHKQAIVNFVKTLEHLYPCDVCRHHLSDNLKRISPLVDSVGDRNVLSVWACQLHNIVNEDLNKPLFNCSIDELDELYLVNCGGCGSTGSQKQAAVPDSTPKEFPTGGLFVPIPNANSNKQQSGNCGNYLETTGVNEWIQGNSSSVSLTSGASTVLFFMSQSCHVCHDVAPKLNKMYKHFRDRGLNLVVLHASPKGYQSTTEDKEGLRQFILTEGLEFPVVDVHAKDGKQPTLADGSPDWDAAGRSKVLKSSLFRKIFGSKANPYPEYYVPIATIWKDCKPIIQDPISGYDIMGLYDTVEENANTLLWTEKQKRKRRKSSSNANTEL
jgi:thiol-disulfide isomerase/thioredoxin